MRTTGWTAILASFSLMLLGCPDEDTECPDDQGQTGDDDAGDDDDSAGPDLCGNAEYDGDEECDAGELNGASNCQDDCTLVQDMLWVVGQAALDLPLFDAVGAVDSAAPIGDGAWGTSDTDQNIDGIVKFEVNVPTDIWADYDLTLFEEHLPADLPAPGAIGEVRLADIDAISFHTRNPVDENNNYYLALYTQPDGVDDYGSFYGYQLIAHPYIARNHDAPVDTWVPWSTDTYVNQLVFADKPILGQSTGEGLPSLSELTAEETFNWSVVNPAYPDMDVPYAAEIIKFVSVQTSSGDATTEFDGLIDALVIRLKDGRSLTLDFETDPA
jgi:hypothetical protein